jgi:hypothetical protein
MSDDDGTLYGNRCEVCGEFRWQQRGDTVVCGCCASPHVTPPVPPEYLQAAPGEGSDDD